MPYHTPEAKTELGLQRIVDQLKGLDLDGVTIIKRLDNARETLPCIKIECPETRPFDESGDQLDDQTVVSVRISVITHYKDAADHDRICGLIRDWLRYEDIPALLNQVLNDEQFQAIHWSRGRTAHNTDGKRHVSEIEGELLMSAADQGAP